MAAFSSQAYALPAFVAAALKSHSGAEGAVDGSTGLAWLFSKKDLLVWRYDEGAAAEVHMRTLPYTSSRRHVVAIAIDQVHAQRQRPSHHYQSLPATFHAWLTYGQCCWDVLLLLCTCWLDVDLSEKTRELD